MDNKTLELEIKIAYMEDYLNQMNNTLIDQVKKVDRLIEVNKLLIDKINLLEENVKEPTDNTPPPHY